MRLAILVVFVVGSLVALVGKGGYLDLQRARNDRLEAALELEARTARVEALRLEVARLRQGGGALERLARERFEMARPGEILFLLPDETARPRTRRVPADSRP